jgi:hypothetical protein
LIKSQSKKHAQKLKEAEAEANKAMEALGEATGGDESE